MSNSVSKCQEWIIIGINHDNTSGTVDLISKYQFYNSDYGTSSDACSGAYELIDSNGSNYYLIGIFINGFTTDVQNAMKVMNKKRWGHYNLYYNGGWYSGVANDIDYTEKMCIPSAKELGYNAGDECGMNWWSYYTYAGSTTNVSLDYSLGSTYEYFSNDNTSKAIAIKPADTNDNNDDTYKSYILRDKHFDISDGAPFISNSHGTYPAPGYTSNYGIFFVKTYDKYSSNGHVLAPLYYNSSTGSYLSYVFIIRF